MFTVGEIVQSSGSSSNEDCTADHFNDYCQLQWALLPFHPNYKRKATTTKSARSYKRLKTMSIPRFSSRCHYPEIMTMFVNVMNAHDPVLLRAFTDQWVAPTALLTKNILTANRKQSTDSLQVRGADSLIQYWTMLLQLSPDQIVRVYDVHYTPKRMKNDLKLDSGSNRIIDCDSLSHSEDNNSNGDSDSDSGNNSRNVDEDNTNKDNSHYDEVCDDHRNFNVHCTFHVEFTQIYELFPSAIAAMKNMPTAYHHCWEDSVMVEDDETCDLQNPLNNNSSTHYILNDLTDIPATKNLVYQRFGPQLPPARLLTKPRKLQLIMPLTIHVQKTDISLESHGDTTYRNDNNYRITHFQHGTPAMGL